MTYGVNNWLRYVTVFVWSRSCRGHRGRILDQIDAAIFNILLSYSVFRSIIRGRAVAMVKQVDGDLDVERPSFLKQITDITKILKDILSCMLWKESVNQQLPGELPERER